MKRVPWLLHETCGRTSKHRTIIYMGCAGTCDQSFGDYGHDRKAIITCLWSSRCVFCIQFDCAVLVKSVALLAAVQVSFVSYTSLVFCWAFSGSVHNSTSRDHGIPINSCVWSSWCRHDSDVDKFFAIVHVPDGNVHWIRNDEHKHSKTNSLTNTRQRSSANEYHAIHDLLQTNSALARLWPVGQLLIKCIIGNNRVTNNNTAREANHPSFHFYFRSQCTQYTPHFHCARVRLQINIGRPVVTISTLHQPPAHAYAYCAMHA